MEAMKGSVVIQHYGSKIHAYLDKCLIQLLGDRINLLWNASLAEMVVSKSETKEFRYEKDGHIEYLYGVEFRHALLCPLLDEEIKRNKQKPIKPCACVMIVDRDSKQFLVTQRQDHLTFGGGWVLPGGHLEQQEGILQGGIRECREQVGLQGLFDVKLGRGVMAWQSSFVENGEIKAAAVILFFSGECARFEVKTQASEVKDYIWRPLQQQQSENVYDSINRTGYCEGHLTYLQLCRARATKQCQ